MQKNIVVFLAVILISFSAFTFTHILKKEKAISIEKAIKEGVVSAEFKGSGSYSGEAINLKIKNLLPTDTLIRIESGRRLLSDDTTVQDILIIREMEFRLLANEIKQLKLFGFCCQAHNSAPGYTGFSVGYMEDSTFIQLAHYLDSTNLPIDVMQHAVWVLSDNNPLNSIHNENKKDKEKMKGLFRLLANLKGIEYEYPWYTLKYATDTASVFSGKPTKMFAEVEYYLPNQSSVDLFIKDANDLLVKKLFINRPHHRGNYTYHFTLDVSKLPKGKYYLRMYADNQLKLNKEFEL